MPQVFDQLGGHAGDQSVRRYVFGDDCTSRDGRALPYRDALEHHRAHGNPDVVADADSGRFTRREVAGGIVKVIVHDNDIRPNANIISTPVLTEIWAPLIRELLPMRKVAPRLTKIFVC